MYRRYGFWGVIRLIISLIYTKLFYAKARLIRLPFDIRNKHLIKIGEKFTTGFGCRIEALELTPQKNILIQIGSNVQINDYVHIASAEHVFIGDNVLIASKVFITDINHGQYKGNIVDSPMVSPNERKLSTNPVVIEENVWLGENVVVLPGTTIGFGSIIGASSVVIKNIPAYSIAVGNPARVLKTYNFETKNWEVLQNK